MSREDWKIVIRIGLITPFLNPIAIVGGLLALYFGVLGIGIASLGLTALAIGTALGLTVAVGFFPALITGYALVSRFRSTLETDGELVGKGPLIRGAITGFVATLALAGPIFALITSEEDPVAGLAVAAIVALFGGGVSGLIAARIARRRLEARAVGAETVFD